ncbi:MAG: magnesium transporter, partial [Alphaproteobacteria bacterium]
MAPETEIGTTPRKADAEAERLYGVNYTLVRTCEDALLYGRYAEVDRLIEPLHASDLADLVEELYGEARARLIDHLRQSLDPETLSHLDEVVREDMLDAMEPAEVAAAITELDTDDAVDVIEDLPAEDQRRILANLSPPDRAVLEEALTFPEDSAGRLMQREIVTVPETWSVGDTIDYMRDRAVILPRDFYDVFVVDPDRKPVGVVPLSRLMRNQRDAKVADIMGVDLHAIPLAMDQEEVALMFRQYRLVSAAVVDADNRLAGVITADDVVHVVHEEAEEDLMRLGGVQEDDFYEAVLHTTRARFPWLLVNLLTVIVASVAIGFFEQTIEKIVALAILMPIVASMGGNAGTQTLTVAVRALAMKELTTTNAKRIVGKEIIVGIFNGLLFAAVMGPIAWMWFGDVAIGGVIAAAMLINLIAAGFAGITTPLVLNRFGIDPAVASTVVLT